MVNEQHKILIVKYRKILTNSLIFFSLTSDQNIKWENTLIRSDCTASSCPHGMMLFLNLQHLFKIWFVFREPKHHVNVLSFCRTLIKFWFLMSVFVTSKG